jgi:hypothetical protein
MKAQELHIGLDLELQKLNSGATKNITPQEKDWFLNKEVLKYVNKHTNKKGNVIGAGFEDNQKRIRDVSDLVTSEEILVDINSEGIGEVLLPSDFFGYIRSEVKVGKFCNENLQTIKVKKYITEFDLNLNTVNFNSLTINIVTEQGLRNVFVSTVDLPVGYIQTLEYQKQAFMLIKALKILLVKKLKTILLSPFDLYWEKVGRDYFQGKFILYSIDKVINSSVDIGTENKVTVSKTKEFKTYSASNTPLLASLRVIDDEFFTEVQNSVLSKSRPDSLIGRFERQSLLLTIPKNTIIKSLKFVYLKNPNIIDLYLNSDLNLNDSSCFEIIANTTKYIKAVIDSDNWEKYTKENILIE